jgi:pSer/pThr/pTyr-binding forkhead associated (FHA) protein
MPRTTTITIQLVHLFGPLKGKIQSFAQFPVLIGRHPSCQVRFDKDLTTISRQHARIEREGNRFRLVDTSTNGTYVNGKRIAGVYLREGDVITFTENGPKTSFLTQNGTDAAAPLPSVTPPAPDAGAKATAAPPSQAPVPPDPEMTIGADLEIPVVGISAPLVVQFGPTLRSFDQLPVTIGTDPACEFVIASETLAARHVQIFFSENDYYAKDLTGRSMVTINDRPVGTRSVLAQGAELSLAPQGPRFRFLGGGRLAEIPGEGQASTSIEDNHSPGNAPEGKRAADDTKVKKKSLLKRFFK